MIGILVLLLTNYLSGYFLFRLFFKKVFMLEIVLIPQIFGMIVTPMTFYILYLAVGFDAALYILPLIFLITCFASFRKKQQTYKEKIGNKFSLLFLILFSFFTAMVFLHYFYNFSELGDQGNWVSISNEIVNSKSLPPDYPCFYDNKVHFQWFYHLMVSLISIYSKVKVFYVVPFFSAYLSILLSLICFLVTRKYLKDARAAFLAMIIIAIFFLDKYTYPSYNGYGLIIAMLTVYIFMKYMEEKSNKLAFLTGFTSASVIYFHTFSFFFASLFLLAYVLYKIVFGMNRKDLMQIFIMAMTFAFMLPYLYASMEYVGTFFIFEPFAGLLFNYISTFNIMLITLPFGILLAIRNKDEMSLIFVSLLIALFVILNTFVTAKNPAYAYFHQYMLIPIVMISLSYVKNLSGLKKKLFIVLAIALFLYPYLNYIQIFQSNQNILKSDEFAAAQWINANTGKDETILTSDTPLYIALSERKTVVCQSVSLIGEYVNPKENFADLIMFYTNPSADLVKKYGISYVVVGDKENDFFKKYDLTPYGFSSGFEKVFSRGSVSIFNLTDVSKLPKVMNETVRNNLNFTSYSRWWQV